MSKPRGSVNHRRIGNLKWCFVCQQYKDTGEFYGTGNLCKSCNSIYYKDYQHSYYLKHRDELLPKHRVSAIESYQRKVRNDNNR